MSQPRQQQASINDLRDVSRDDIGNIVDEFFQHGGCGAVESASSLAVIGSVGVEII